MQVYLSLQTAEYRACMNSVDLHADVHGMPV